VAGAFGDWGVGAAGVWGVVSLLPTQRPQFFLPPSQLRIDLGLLGRDGRRSLVNPDFGVFPQAVFHVFSQQN